MRVKGGTVGIPQGSTLTNNELTIHVAALLSLRIEWDPPALAGPASGPGSEATHAQATLPEEAAFAFGPLGLESIETGPAALSVYSNDITLTRNVSQAAFEPMLRMVLI